MAVFVGTNREFRRFIGPRLRNLVQQFTKNHKATIATCEHCGSKENLESAHVQGNTRNAIIDLVLNEFTRSNVVTVGMDAFEERFKQKHQPLENTILILCRDCHKKYDSAMQQSANKHQSTFQSQDQSSSLAYNQGHLPITLEPSDPKAFKKELLFTKLAHIETAYTDGRVERKPWNATKFSISSNLLGNQRSRPEFRSCNWQSSGIVKVHVKVVNNESIPH